MARSRAKPELDTRKIAVYARKSKVTESGKSIDIQREKCIALACAQFGVTIGEILVYEDEGKSGFYADRPQYKRLLHDIEHNRIRAVICYKIDRISRRTVDLLNLVQQMEQKGIAFVSVSDKELDTSTRTGKIMISLLSAIAEFERDIIAERITDNMYELAKEGRWLGGVCPLGYASKKERFLLHGRKTTVNHLEPVADEQMTVKRLFSLFMQTGSLTGTAAALNKENRKTKKGGAFTLAAVQNILRNPVYAMADTDMQHYFQSFSVPVWADDKDFNDGRGMMAYNKTEQLKEMDADARALDPKYTQKTTRRDIQDWIVAVGRHRGIISGADWIRAQKLLAEIARESAARPKEGSQALLSGLIRCAACGGRMLVRAETGRYNPDGSLRFRYVCGAKRGKGGGEHAPNIRGQALDHFVVEEISKLRIGENTFYSDMPQIKSSLLTQSGDADNTLYALKKRLSQIERGIQNQAANLRTAPESAKPAIFSDMAVLDREREETTGRIKEMTADKQTRHSRTADIETAQQTMMDFSQLVKQADNESKRQLLRRILAYVLVKDGTVHIFLTGTGGDSCEDGSLPL